MKANCNTPDASTIQPVKDKSFILYKATTHQGSNLNFSLLSGPHLYYEILKGMALENNEHTQKTENSRSVKFSSHIS